MGRSGAEWRREEWAGALQWGLPGFWSASPPPLPPHAVAVGPPWLELQGMNELYAPLYYLFRTGEAVLWLLSSCLVELR